VTDISVQQDPKVLSTLQTGEVQKLDSNPNSKRNFKSLNENSVTALE